LKIATEMWGLNFRTIYRWEKISSGPRLRHIDEPRARRALRTERAERPHKADASTRLYV